MPGATGVIRPRTPAVAPFIENGRTRQKLRSRAGQSVSRLDSEAQPGRGPGGARHEGSWFALSFTRLLRRPGVGPFIPPGQRRLVGHAALGRGWRLKAWIVGDASMRRFELSRTAQHEPVAWCGGSASGHARPRAAGQRVVTHRRGPVDHPALPADAPYAATAKSSALRTTSDQLSVLSACCRSASDLTKPAHSVRSDAWWSSGQR
jgi:hypothetical protein